MCWTRWRTSGAAALGLGKPRPLAVAHDIYFSRQSKLFKSLESRGPPYGVWEKAGLSSLRRQLGPASVGWLAQEVENWIRSRPPVGTAAGKDQSQNKLSKEKKARMDWKSGEQLNVARGPPDSRT